MRESKSSAQISIHAPVKGATVDVFDTIHLQPISIHAPVKGATPAKPGFYKDTLDFNPRSREGSDRTTDDQRSQCRYFNPRSREGSDVILLT